ncbi:MAG: hypothetical protein IJ597_08255 [Synergistaceae bacterium]|nr:hypothetical protein [Synergistaceae bacterium]
MDEAKKLIFLSSSSKYIRDNYVKRYRKEEGIKVAKYLICPNCGSTNCEIVAEPERRVNWSGILFHLHDGAPFTKQVLQQKGHCLDC